MTIENLITLLEEIASINPGIEVRLMTQSHWPFEYSIQGLTTTSEMDEAESEDKINRLQDLGIIPEAAEAEALETAEGRMQPSAPEREEILYLVEGCQLGYGRKAAWTTCTC
jgi:hypothetical protein